MFMNTGSDGASKFFIFKVFDGWQTRFYSDGRIKPQTLFRVKIKSFENSVIWCLITNIQVRSQYDRKEK